MSGGTVDSGGAPQRGGPVVGSGSRKGGPFVGSGGPRTWTTSCAVSPPKRSAVEPGAASPRPGSVSLPGPPAP